MKIDFQVIPHSQQRYETVGDYWEADGVVHFRVSHLGDARYEWLVFFHELVEKQLCDFAGIVNDEIDAFDMAYEKARDSERAPCGCPIQDEPGFDKHAPYYWQHRFADVVERAAAFALGVDWVAYEKEIDALYLPSD